MSKEQRTRKAAVVIRQCDHHKFLTRPDMECIRLHRERHDELIFIALWNRHGKLARFRYVQLLVSVIKKLLRHLKIRDRALHRLAYDRASSVSGDHGVATRSSSILQDRLADVSPKLGASLIEKEMNVLVFF